MYSTEEFTKLVVDAIIADKRFRPELEERAAQKMADRISRNTRVVWALEDAARMLSEIYDEVDDEVCSEYEREAEAEAEMAAFAKRFDVRITKIEMENALKEQIRKMKEEEAAASKLDQIIEWAKKNGGSFEIDTDGETTDIKETAEVRSANWMKDFESGIQVDLEKARNDNGFITVEQWYNISPFEADPEDLLTDDGGEPYTKYHDTEEEFENCYHCNDNDRPYWK